MTGLANNPLQKAVYTALTGNAPLMAQVTAVWDEPDENAPLPIVAIGEATTVDNSSKTTDGQIHTLSLHVWSGEHGKMELKNIMGLVYDALNGASLTLDGHTLVCINFDNANDLRELEGEKTVYHGIMRFRAITEKI